MSKMIELTDDELDVVAAELISKAGDDITIINSGSNAQGSVGGLIGNLNVTNGLVIISADNNINFNFDDSAATPTGVHIVLTGFNGAGVDGGHVITFEGGANDVTVTEHDGHTTLSWADDNFDLTVDVDAIGLATGTDWFLV
jgi:hypothetical protein